MDYEKLYKEALNKAKEELQCCGTLECDAARQIFRFFPELKESEDERIRNFLIDFIKVCVWTEKKDQGWPLKEECINWLEKQGEQKSTLSKDDKEMLESIITCADRDLFIHKEQIDWLKSLRHKNKWKPSEEQLNAFEHFVRSVGESGYASPYNNNTKLLYSLLNDLKNL